MGGRSRGSVGGRGDLGPAPNMCAFGGWQDGSGHHNIFQRVPALNHDGAPFKQWAEALAPGPLNVPERPSFIALFVSLGASCEFRDLCVGGHTSPIPQTIPTPRN